MKRRIAALACVLAAALALPGTAFGEVKYEEGVPEVATSEQGATIRVTSSGEDDVLVDGLICDTERKPDNYEEPEEGGVYAGTFFLTMQAVNKGDDTMVEVEFNVGEEYAGRTATVFIQGAHDGPFVPQRMDDVVIGEDGSFTLEAQVRGDAYSMFWGYRYSINIDSDSDDESGSVAGSIDSLVDFDNYTGILFYGTDATTGSIDSLERLDTPVSGYVPNEGDAWVQSYKATGDLENYRVEFWIPGVPGYAGLPFTARLWIEYADGTVEVRDQYVQGNDVMFYNVGFEMDELASFTCIATRNPEAIPSEFTVDAPNGTSMTVQQGDATTGGLTIATWADETASNLELGAGDVVLDSFRLEGTLKNFTLTFSVDAAYNGRTVTLFVEHGDGTTEVKTATVKDGSVTFEMDRLSIYTLVLNGASGATETDVKVDESDKSPQTGLPVAFAAAATAAAATGSAVCAVRVWRKRR